MGAVLKSGKFEGQLIVRPPLAQDPLHIKLRVQKL